MIGSATMLRALAGVYHDLAKAMIVWARDGNPELG
jgi:hypothetical protein